MSSFNSPHFHLQSPRSSDHWTKLIHARYSLPSWSNDEISSYETWHSLHHRRHVPHLELSLWRPSKVLPKDSFSQVLRVLHPTATASLASSHDSKHHLRPLQPRPPSSRPPTKPLRPELLMASDPNRQHHLQRTLKPPQHLHLHLHLAPNISTHLPQQSKPPPSN